MDIKLDIYLNQLGQGVLDQEDGLNWFGQLSTSHQLDVLRRLVFFILQMGGTSRDVNASIELSKLKKTFTPCRILIKASEEANRRRGLSDGLTKIVNLPENERLKSFKLILALFVIVSKSNRMKGLNPKKYWWHRDLAKQHVVDEITNEFSNENQSN